LLLGVALDEVGGEALDRVAAALFLRLDLLRAGIDAGLDVVQRRRRGLARFGERQPGVERQLPRLAVEPVAHGPRASAGRLQEEVQSTTAAVRDLATASCRLEVRDCNWRERLGHNRSRVCYPDWFPG